MWILNTTRKVNPPVNPGFPGADVHYPVTNRHITIEIKLKELLSLRIYHSCFPGIDNYILKDHEHSLPRTW